MIENEVIKEVEKIVLQDVTVPVDKIVTQEKAIEVQKVTTFGASPHESRSSTAALQSKRTNVGGITQCGHCTLVMSRLINSHWIATSHRLLRFSRLSFLVSRTYTPLPACLSA